MRPATISRHEARRLLAAPPAPPSPKSRIQALGRLKSGTMNATEKLYADKLERDRVAGEIAWWRFEGIKLRLADKTFLTVDFAVMQASGLLRMIDVKGAPGMVQDDARVKMKVAAEQYPFEFSIVYPAKRGAASAWREEAI